MARYPGAAWRDIGAHAGYKSNGRMRSYRGAVLHVNVSNGNLFNWVNSPSVEMSTHFEVYKDGSLEQYVDTDYSSWCQSDGNNDWISIETEGYPDEQLTAAQVNAIAGLVAWLNATHGMPFVLAEAPAGSGFGWHGMGGVAWGNHPGCPGDLRRGQRQQILNIAQGLSPSGGGTPLEDNVLDDADKAWLTQMTIDVVDSKLAAIGEAVWRSPLDPHAVINADGNPQDVAPGAGWPPRSTAGVFLVDIETRTGNAATGGVDVAQLAEQLAPLLTPSIIANLPPASTLTEADIQTACSAAITSTIRIGSTA